MKYIVTVLFSMLCCGFAFSQTSPPLPSGSIYAWYLWQPNDVFQFRATNRVTSIHVAVDDWVRGTNNRPDLTTVICDGLEYKLLKGDALRCDLSPQGMLVIQNKNYKYGATGTYEIIQ